jgi:hypothetical protein
VFPFAGARGGFLHSGSALQLVWWALIPIGLDSIIEWGGRARRWNIKRSRILFPILFILLAAVTTVIISIPKLYSNGDLLWGKENMLYREIGATLQGYGMKDDVVIVANPPGFWLATGNPAIVLPDADVDTVVMLAERYGARYLILEDGSVTQGFIDVYNHPSRFPNLVYLGEVKDARLFEIKP